MAKRTDTHEKETIACRAFEQALSPKLVAQPTIQGSDYGVDYSVSVFVKRIIKRKYQVQVKYLNKKTLKKIDYTRTLLDVYQFISEPLYGDSDLPYSLKKSTLRDYLLMNKQTKTLIVCANEQHLYSIWFNDYYNYYLKWIKDPLKGKGVISLYFHGLRCLARVIHSEEDGFDSENIVFPGAKEYENAREIYSLGSIKKWYPTWIDSWFDSGILDSISGVGFSSYIAYLNNSAQIKKRFEVDGFWKYLLSEDKKKQYSLLCFTHFIGCLSPTKGMKKWALDIILSWDDCLKIPVAFQILANEDIPKNIESILDKLETLYKNNIGNIYHSFFMMSKHVERDARLNAEFSIGLARFFEKTIANHKNTRSQKLLISSFYNFDYSINCDNAFERILLNLLKQKKLITKDESFQKLKTVLQYKEGNSLSLAKVIVKKSYEWAIEADSK